MSDAERIAYLAGGTDRRLSRIERAQLDELRRLLRDPAVWVEPDPALQDRVVAAMADATRPAAMSKPAAIEDPAVPRRGSRWLPYTVLGAAAAAVLAIAVAVGLSGRKAPDRPPEFGVALYGTDLAPRASGHVSLTRTRSGWKVYLHATGLPRRAGEEFYEAWLKDAAGALVPIGTFNEPDDVFLWAGVSPGRYRTLTVTVEPADGDQSSSGRVVAVGTSHRVH